MYQTVPPAPHQAMTYRCDDLEPCAMLRRTVCLQSVSKDVEGGSGRQCQRRANSDPLAAGGFYGGFARSSQR